MVIVRGGLSGRLCAVGFLVAALGCTRANDPPPVTPVAGETSAERTYALGELRRVGTIDFPTSCEPEAQAEIVRGVALLHSFFYEEARRIFEGIAERSPDCAMAHWGVAMTLYHPLWAPPSEAELEAGRAAIERARAAHPPTDRERDYIDALTAYYASDSEEDGPARHGCHGPIGPAGRASAWSEAMQGLHERHPDDAEAEAFFALSLLAAAPPVDPELANQRRAAEILERLWRTNRDHPGVAHYLIHAYDFPPLAELGLEAAQAYGAIAPWVPHVLHMPSHIFTRLGMWPDAIEANLASADAARSYEATYHPGAASFEELHALDYLAYAYLQSGQEGRARAVVERVNAIEHTYPEIDFAAAYALGAIPARFAIERHAWSEAATLSIPERPFWGPMPFAEAHLELARALGRAHTADLQGTRRSIARLQELRAALTEPRFEYFRNHLDIQVTVAGAHLAQAEGRADEAVQAMERAADAEDALGKHPVSPGALYPVRELLGDMLLELDRPAEALPHFETSLRAAPRRLNGVLGAALAAERSGDRAAARRHHAAFVALVERGDGWREQLARSRAFLAEEGAPAASR